MLDSKRSALEDKTRRYSDTRDYAAATVFPVLISDF